MGVCQNIPKTKYSIKANSSNKGQYNAKYHNHLMVLPSESFQNSNMTKKTQETDLTSKESYTSSYSNYKLETTPSNIYSNTTCVQSNLNNKPKSFIIEATIGEIELPITAEKKEKIIIKINQNIDNNFYKNNKINDLLPYNHWSFFKNEKPVNYLGYNNHKYKNANIGTLYLRISGDKNIYCLDKLENHIITNNKGNLLLFANTDQNDYMIYEPKGFISISIIGGNFSYENELYYSYNINSFANNYKSNYDTKEYKILKYMNKARDNLKKFYHDYYSFNDIINQEFKEFINNNNNFKLKELKMNKELNTLAEEHCEDLCENETAGHTNTDGIDLKERFNNCYKCYYFGESIIYNINNPLLIVKCLIQDKYSKKKKNRKNIFFNQFNQVGISLKKHPIYNFCCVLVFSE